jgi:ankyrin repeat protein
MTINAKSALIAGVALLLVAVIVGAFALWQTGNIDIGGLGAITNQRGQELAAQDQEALDKQLFQAANAGNAAEVERLLEEGADLNTVSSFGTIKDISVLGSAVSLGNTEVVRVLIEQGADVNAVDGNGNAMLPQAALRGYLEIVGLLLDAGADVNGTMSVMAGDAPKENAAALQLAALGNHKEIVELLLAHGPEVNAVDVTYGESALYGAARHNNIEIMALLLENGADVQMQSKGGETPLHRAAQWGAFEAAQLLLDHGAAVDVESLQGWTPLDVSTADEVDELLRAAGATE